MQQIVTSRHVVFSHGQENPIAPNSTEAGRARNRRVEMRVNK